MIKLALYILGSLYSGLAAACFFSDQYVFGSFALSVAAFCAVMIYELSKDQS